MKLRQVAPSAIMVPELRVTSVWDSEALQEFKASLKALGVLEPIVAVQTNGDLVLVDGLHRLQEALEEKLTLVPVVVMDGTMRDVLIQNLALNNLRGKTNPTEMALVLTHLHEEEKMGIDEISQKSGFSEERVSNLIWLGRAHPEIRQGVDEGWLPLSGAYEISRLPDMDRQYQVLSLVKQHRLRVDAIRQLCHDVATLTQSRLDTPPLPVDLDSHLAQCRFCHRSFEPIDLLVVSVCLGCAGGLTDLLRAAQAARSEEAKG